MRTCKQAFETHKIRAKQRGIPFKFTFKEWCRWWELHLGPDWFNKRGRKTGQYVMARYKDKGAYEWDNVRCVVGRVNHHESHAGSKNPAAKLTEAQVKTIFNMPGSYHPIAALFGTTRSRVYRIKTGRTWKHLDLLK